MSLPTVASLVLAALLGQAADPNAMPPTSRENSRPKAATPPEGCSAPCKLMVESCLDACRKSKQAFSDRYCNKVCRGSMDACTKACESQQVGQKAKKNR
jgi:hypothetical protein